MSQQNHSDSSFTVLFSLGSQVCTMSGRFVCRIKLFQYACFSHNYHKEIMIQSTLITHPIQRFYGYEAEAEH